MSAGRPTIFNEKLAGEICRRLMDGESLRQICEDEKMPNRSSVHLWLSENKEFSDHYARARDAQADTYADEMIHIADTELDPQKARVRVDTRKWVASKLKPKRYGDKLDLTTAGKELPTPILNGLSVKEPDDKQTL